MLWLAPAAVRAQDDFATFFEQKQAAIMRLHSLGTDQSRAIAPLLDEMRKRALEEPEGKERYDALHWMVEQYEQVGQAAAAATICESLTTDKSASPQDLHGMQVELVRLYGESGSPDKAATVLSGLLNDSQTPKDEKSQLVATTLPPLMDSHGWAAAEKVAEQALADGLGNPRDLYAAIGKSAMEAGDYEKGTKAYETLRNQYAGDMNPFGLLQLDKDLLRCHQDGKVDSVEYLADLALLLDKYRTDPKASEALGGSLLTEYAALAQGWLGVAQAYAVRGEASPVSAEAARDKALQIALTAYEALDALSEDQQRHMPNYQTPLIDACFAAIESLTASGRFDEAKALLARLKAKMPPDVQMFTDRMQLETTYVAQAEEKASRPSPTPGPEIAAATPLAPVPPRPIRTAQPIARTPLAAAPVASAAAAAGPGGMGAGTVGLIVALLAAAALLLVLAMRKPKKP
jgi:hypothetical protein